MAKEDRQSSERQQALIVDIANVVNTLKENIEESKFAKGEDEEGVAQWSKGKKDELAKADENIRMLAQQIKQIDDRDQDDKTVHDHEQGRNQDFEKGSRFYVLKPSPI